MTRALALELIPFGIRVNCLCPGITNTPMCQAEADMYEDPGVIWEAWKKWAPIGRWADPIEQARAVLYLLRDATFSVGSVLVTDGGYTTL
jgi:NAD(P)-dependent dehydrogenase (short-subunit alcohol dehydrogenase family)